MKEIPTLKEIIDRSRPSDDIYNLYFLILEEEIVYVGKSNNVEGRLYDHRRNKEFDSYSVFECESEKDSLRLEALAIMKYKPRYNSQLNEEFQSMTMIKNTLKKLDIPEKFHHKRFLKKKIMELGIKTHIFNVNPFISNNDAKALIEVILGECNE